MLTNPKTNQVIILIIFPFLFLLGSTINTIKSFKALIGADDYNTFCKPVNFVSQ